jgi:hypothetical protein
MCFVGHFVGRKPDVAIKTVGAIFDGDALYGWIETGNSDNQFFDKRVESFIGSNIFGLVGVKPGFVVVIADLV